MCGGMYAAPNSSDDVPLTTTPAAVEEYPVVFLASLTNLHRGGEGARYFFTGVILVFFAGVISDASDDDTADVLAVASVSPALLAAPTVSPSLSIAGTWRSPNSTSITMVSIATSQGSH